MGFWSAKRSTERPAVLSRSDEDDGKKERSIIPIHVYRASGYSIPKEELTEEAVEDAFERFLYRFYEDRNCQRCEYLPDRHSETCDDCASYKGATRTSKIVVAKNKEYLTLPIGEKDKVIRWMKTHGYRPTVVDKFAAPAPIHPFKFTRKPYEYQVEAVRAWLASERGIIESKPRTGKTIMGAMAVRVLKQKTLILAHQREWLENFMETFIGSDKVQAFTTMDPKYVAFCKKVEEFERVDVALATFQQFFNENGQRVLAQIRQMFPVVIVDEMHYGAAPKSVKILAQLKAKWRLGLTGTPERKDGRYLLVNSVVGQVVHKTEAGAMKPTVVPFETSLNFEMGGRGGPGAFVFFKKRIESNTTRMMLIVERAIKRAKQGHFVIIPLSLTNSIKNYVRVINQEAEEDWARPFDGKLKKDLRKSTIEDARSFKFRILVANIALISTGVNIPRASCLIDGCTPSSNLPKAKQRLSRILTPMSGKPDPIIDYVLDGGKEIRSMRRNEFYNCLIREFNPTITREHFGMFKDYFNVRPPNSYTRNDFF